jgi:hypothetical protein
MLYIYIFISQQTIYIGIEKNILDSIYNNYTYIRYIMVGMIQPGSQNTFSIIVINLHNLVSTVLFFKVIRFLNFNTFT